MLSVVPNPRITFRIEYQDDDLLVVDKPSGRVTQPGKGHDSDSLLNGIFAQFGARLQQLGAARDFGLLHRLDRDTSGLLIVALRAPAYDALRAAFENRRIAKFYWAVCAKAPDGQTGLIDRPLLETTPRSGEMKLAKITRAGKPASTAYRVLARSRKAALIEARPLTGRLHQVRVHLESIGCPLLGDQVYAAPKYAAAAPRLMLHAHRLVFAHPITGATIDAHSPSPREMRGVCARLELPRPEDALPAGAAASGSTPSPGPASTPAPKPTRMPAPAPAPRGAPREASGVGMPAGVAKPTLVPSAGHAAVNKTARVPVPAPAAPEIAAATTTTGTKPVTAEPATEHPTSKPAKIKPAAKKPASTKPARAKSATAKPAAAAKKTIAKKASKKASATQPGAKRPPARTRRSTDA
jgi:23S rRNA pseudouridine1911/1915/1917 synthase